MTQGLCTAISPGESVFAQLFSAQLTLKQFCGISKHKKTAFLELQ